MEKNQPRKGLMQRIKDRRELSRKWNLVKYKVRGQYTLRINDNRRAIKKLRTRGKARNRDKIDVLKEQNRILVDRRKVVMANLMSEKQAILMELEGKHPTEIAARYKERA